MSQIDTQAGVLPQTNPITITPASVTVSPQPSVVTNVVTNANPAIAVPASAATNPFVDPNGTGAIQNNAPIGAVKTVIGGQLATVAFANPA